VGVKKLGVCQTCKTATNSNNDNQNGLKIASCLDLACNISLCGWFRIANESTTLAGKSFLFYEKKKREK
jgi:hypothetical protein